METEPRTCVYVHVSKGMPILISNYKSSTSIDLGAERRICLMGPPEDVADFIHRIGRRRLNRW